MVDGGPLAVLSSESLGELHVKQSVNICGAPIYTVLLLPQQNRDMGTEGAGGQRRGPTKEVTFGPEGPIGKRR